MFFQRIDTLLPPPYREVWQEWRNADDAAKKKVAADDVKVSADWYGKVRTRMSSKFSLYIHKHPHWFSYMTGKHFEGA
jgi:hypothetical protein